MGRRLDLRRSTLHAKILALAHHWHATFVVVDATGVGAGLGSFLEKALRDRLIAVQFGPKVKSEPGWDLGSSRLAATATRWRTPDRTRANSGTKSSTASTKSAAARPGDALGRLGDPRLRRPHRVRPR